MDYVSETKMDMRKVRSIRPWTDKEGNERFYIRDVGSLVSEYRHATGRSSGLSMMISMVVRVLVA